jgi:predicted nucleic acid-binding protein
VQDRGFEAILDDRDARNCAIVHGVPVRGTLGVVMLAKQEGLLPSARVACESLVKAGLYLERSFMNNALALVGE